MLSKVTIIARDTTSKLAAKAEDRLYSWEQREVSKGKKAAYGMFRKGASLVKSKVAVKREASATTSGDQQQEVCTLLEVQQLMATVAVRDRCGPGPQPARLGKGHPTSKLAWPNSIQLASPQQDQQHAHPKQLLMLNLCPARHQQLLPAQAPATCPVPCWATHGPAAAPYPS